MHKNDFVALFETAGNAHHAAFAAVNGEDDQWPAWYAHWLASRLSTHLASVPTETELAQQLQQLDREYRSAAPAMQWPEYYAGWFMRKYGAAPD